MSLVRITCPHCGHCRDIEKSRIPADCRQVVCRTCNGTFPLGELVAVSPQAAPAGAVSAPLPRRIPFTFTGKGREYFGIWIVNTLLKIVTLGIYSPWAKVRKRQYFYGNTLLDDANFDYLANPIALLKGWLIGAALFLCYTIGSHYSPLAGGILGIVFFFLMPWVIVRSRLFNNRNSAHRNVRFNFRPAYAEAYKVFAWLPILTALTAGLLTPYVFYRQKRFLVENNSFGTAPFAFEARVRDFYFIALKTLGIGLLLIGGGVAASALLLPGLPGNSRVLPAVAGFGMPLLALSSYFLVATYAYVRTANLTWNSSRIRRNHFVSTLRARDLLWIFVSNLVASVLSCGLLIPWASVRLARYRLNNLALVVRDDLDRFSAARLEETSAAGEEIGDIFGFDIGI